LVSSTAKRVVLYRFDRQPLEGIVNPAAYLLVDRLELITVSGTIHAVPYGEAKALCFVSEFASADLFQGHKLFERRPRVPGLWTRFTFLDGDQLDGVLSHNLLEWPAQGYLLVPPKASASRQKVFVPRDALRKTELRGVVGAPATTSKRAKPDQKQIDLFD
jgi:hypothetical protein